MKKIFKFYWDCGRQGEVEGTFIASQEDVDKVIGKNVYFGEILGKHSEVYGVIGAEDIREVSNDPKAVELLREIFGEDTISGYNPLEYVEESEEDNE